MPDAATIPDGALHGGISVTWNANPALPGNVGKVTVTDASFQVEHLQLISDAASDERTIHSRYQLHWGAGMTPPKDEFPTAPVAVYQKILLDMRPGVQLPFAVQILGMWQDEEEDEAKPFRISDPVGLVLPIDCSASLPAGGSVSVAIRVDLKDALNIDFSHINDDHGVLVVTGQPLAEFHTRLSRAFKVNDD